MKLVTATQMQGLDRRTIEEGGVPGKTLMERAGTGVVTHIEQRFGPIKGKTVTIVCGKGNNGGDGFVVGRLLRRKRARVNMVLLAKPSALKGDAKTMYLRLTKLTGSAAFHTNPSEKTLIALLEKSDLVVDGLLGTGIDSPVKDANARVIDAMNQSKVPIISIDLPSGIHTDTGAILGTAIRASLTVTFGYPKLGLYLGPAIDHVGTIRTVDIGIPPHYIDALSIRTHLPTDDLVRDLLPPRLPSSHKGTFGHAGIIAGSPGKTGAAAMAARAALRVGTGLVTVATPVTANRGLEPKILEAMTVPMPESEEGTLGYAALPAIRTFIKDRTSLAIGPGLGLQHETADIIRSVITGIDRPCVIDADALTALTGSCELLRTCRVSPILTPHPGEMARLLGESRGQAVNQDRLNIALDFAEHHRVILVLKGARTIVASPDRQAAICSTGNPGMATAGMGDALTGILVGLLAQGLSPWDTARAGVYLHGLAGDLAAERVGETGMITGDVIESLPAAIQKVQHS